MLFAALRDLQWRRRRFTIAVVGTALVFMLTLVISGLSYGFGVEAEGTVEDLGADGWLVADGAAGPFLGAAPVPAGVAEEAAALAGVEAAAPLVYARKAVGEDGDEEVNLWGSTPGGPVSPVVTEGRRPEAAGEIAVSTKLAGTDVGDEVIVGGLPYEVVGEVAGSTALAGVPNVFLTLEDAQAVAFAGQPIANSIGLAGRPTEELDGYQTMTNEEAEDDLLRPLGQARSAISLIAVLLWIVAATIVGSVIYLSALERVRDFAVFKATGVSTGAIVRDLGMQAVLLAVAAAVVGAIGAVFLGPRFPIPVEIPGILLVLLPAIAVVVGVVASLAGMRRAVAVDPALAFAGR